MASVTAIFIFSVLDSIHLLLADGGVEDGFLLVSMEEDDAIGTGCNTVAEGLSTLRGSKFPTALEGLTTCHLTVFGTPRLVSHVDVTLLLLRRHFDMHHGFVDISPDDYPVLAVRYLTIAVVEY
jgi:hypothetical protein